MEATKDNVLKISKELVSEVLGYDVIKTDTKDNILRYDCDFDNIVDTKIINIYEFSFKCKEWAYNKGYIIKSFYSLKESFAILETAKGKEEIIDLRIANTEVEAIIKACEWILTQKDKKC